MRKIVIGMLGCGNIGCGVYQLLTGFSQELMHRCGVEVEIRRILVRDKAKKRAAAVPEALLTTRFEDVINDPAIAYVIETLGGETPATDYMIRALQAGKTVITANKMALALNWDKLQTAAKAGGAGLFFEAAVGGAMPIVKMLDESLTANRIDSIKAIINGTTNYILSRMTAEGLEYEAVLQDAKRLGFAEPDPASDVEGEDAAYKLSILASLAFHLRLPARYIGREGITHIKRLDIEGAREWGYCIKLLAIASREGNAINVAVQPALVPLTHPLAAVSGPFNAVYLNGHACGEMMVYGRGAGSAPTASAIVSDLLCAAGREKQMLPTFRNDQDELPDGISIEKNRRCAFYMRLRAKDAVGVLAHVTGCLSAAGVSVRAMLQPENKFGSETQITLMTHPAEEQKVRDAVAALDNRYVTLENLIHVEE